jgi:gentisate 1,2-dioxygenase
MSMIEGNNRASEMEALHQATKKLNLFEFWSEDPTNERGAVDRLSFFIKAVPHIWRFAEIEPCLRKAGELITMEESERRSLIMVNPALHPLISTVSTMFSAYRINMPNEYMPAHRHSPNAIRFGLTGSTNFTGVDGEPITFGPGDLVLTPHDTWHNHGNGDDSGSINLSVLDMPLVNQLNATYFEHQYFEGSGPTKTRKDVQSDRFSAEYSRETYGAGGLLPRGISHKRGYGTSSPMFVYRWDATAAMLERLKNYETDPYDGVMLEFTNPTTGGPVYKTMTFFMKLLRPGERTPIQRQTANQIVNVFQGKGTTTIGGRDFAWNKFDTFCIPGGEWYEHVNETQNDAIFMISSDEPTLKALGFYMRHGQNQSGEAVSLL